MKHEVYRATYCPSTRELEWAAGFLEGEACFSIAQRTSRCESIHASQVNKEPLEKLWYMFGGSLRMKAPRKNQQSYWHWQVTGARARGIMLTLYSLLSDKRQNEIRFALSAKPGPLRVTQHKSLVHFELLK